MDEDRTLDFDLEHTGAPPYSGTSSFSRRVIEPSDPTRLGSITYAGRGERYVPDRRPSTWITINAYLFDVRYGGQVVEFRVNPEFGSTEAAQAEVETYAPALGQMPAVLLSAITHVVINAGDELWGGGGSSQGGILIHTDQGEDYIRRGVMEETMVHEATHAALDPAHRDSPGWRAAQTADGVFISTYARDFPDREDVAVSFRVWFAVRYQPERLNAVHRAVIRRTIPSRLAYFDEQGFDMSPYTPSEVQDDLSRLDDRPVDPNMLSMDGQVADAFISLDEGSRGDPESRTNRVSLAQLKRLGGRIYVHWLVTFPRATQDMAVPMTTVPYYEDVFVFESTQDVLDVRVGRTYDWETARVGPTDPDSWVTGQYGVYIYDGQRKVAQVEFEVVS